MTDERRKGFVARPIAAANLVGLKRQVAPAARSAEITGNRLEFRDFGVFEARQRAARMAQNPKTPERVQVPTRRAVRFKADRLMKGTCRESCTDTAVSETFR